MPPAPSLPNLRGWINPTAINGPNADPGASWDGILPEGCEIEALYWAFSIGKLSGGSSNWPIVSASSRAWFNDGFGAVFGSVKVHFTLSPSSGTNYLLGYGGAILPRPFRLTEHDKRVDVVLFPGSQFGGVPLGTGTYTPVKTGETVDGSYFNLGTALRVNPRGVG